MKILMKAGKSILGLLEAIRVRLAPLTDRVLDGITGPRVTPSWLRARCQLSFQVVSTGALLPRD